MCGKKIISTHKRAQRHNGRWGSPDNTLPQLLQGLSQEPPPCYNPISPNPEDHRSQRQAGTQIMDSEEKMPCLGHSQNCPRRALVSTCDTHHHESVLEHLLNRVGWLSWAIGHIMDAGLEHFQTVQDLLWSHNLRKEPKVL